MDDLNNKDDLRYKLLDHFKNYNSYQPIFHTPIERRIGTQPEPFESWFEVDVYNDLIRKKLSVLPQYKVANGRYRIDMVALLPDGTKIAIECDGDKWHGPEQYQNDVMRQKVLERCGWQFFRVRGYEYYTNREKALEPLWNMIPVLEDNESESLLQSREEIQVKTGDSLEIISTEVDLETDGDETTREPFEQVSSRAITDKILRYFNLFKSGTYVLTVDKPLEADYVIPILECHQKGFLLQCYQSGHINKVHIPILLARKIGKEYLNGLNKNDQLVNIQTIDSEGIIGIYFDENGRRKFKAHLTENISTREQLHLQGYKVIYNEFDSIEYRFLPLEILNEIKRLVFQSFTATGKPNDNNYYDSEWSILNRYSNKSEEQYQRKEDLIPHPIIDNRIGLNSMVKIKYVEINKEFIVKLVDYDTSGGEFIDGVQIVNILKPLGASIKGKTIGDRVKVGDKDVEVEIIDIR